MNWKKLFFEIVLLYFLAWILIGCSKTPQTSTAPAAVDERAQQELQELQAAQKKWQQQNQGTQLPDPTKVKLTK